MNGLIKVAILEIIQASIFLTLIMALENMSEMLPLLHNFTIMVVFIWIVLGIATPVFFYVELHKAIDGLFKKLNWLK